eukprot:CCRYP_011755-RA/>CCRYP_011755-RA protein AED:0.44 eAED:0.44 QI:77/1/1/1/1/1/2/229/223
MNLPSDVRPSAVAYNAQLRIRREAEERSIAQQELNSWMTEIKDNKATSNANRSHSRTGTVSGNTTTTLEQKPSQTNEFGSVSLEEERLRGNSFFSQGKYQEAIQSYTRCLSNKDALTSPVVYSNRAMAYLKAKNWICAETDATAALKIDRHFKSYQRRCVARLSLGKLRAAMMDACAAEDCFGSDNDSTLNELHALQQKVQNSLLLAVTRAPRRNIIFEVIHA